MGKPNYQFEKRRRELEKQKKKEEKRQRKMEKQLLEKKNPVQPPDEENIRTVPGTF